MAKRGVSTVIFLEELTKVEQELSLLQHELNDAQKLNDDLAKKIDRKDKELTMKDEKLRIFKEKNAAELEQLALELQAERDKYSHELKFHETELAMLRLNKQRVEDLQAENDRLLSAISYLEEQIRSESSDHAMSLHEMNKSMKTLRHQMESKLRRELANLDISFQKEAFNALHEKQKKAMFENAKLKDEVALQGVGIANLSARLARQKMQHDRCIKQLQQLNNKSGEMRELLAHITQHKADMARLREQLNSDMERLMGEKQRLLSSLREDSRQRPPGGATLHPPHVSSLHPNHVSSHATLPNLFLPPLPAGLILPTSSTALPPSLPESIGEREQESIFSLAQRNNVLHQTLHLLAEQTRRWQQRYLSLQGVTLELRPCLPDEKQGRYLPSLFPLYPLAKKLGEHLANGEGDSDNESVHSRSSIDTLNNIDSLLPALDWQLLTSLSPLSSSPQPSTNVSLQPDPDLISLLAPLQGLEESYLSAMRQIAAQEYMHTVHRAREEERDEEEDDEGERGNGEGKEGKGGVVEEIGEQNMMAWALLKIFVAWHCLPTDSHLHSDDLPPDEPPSAEHGGEREEGNKEEVWIRGETEEEGREWLSLPPAHRSNIFAQQLQEKVVKAPLHSSLKYSIRERLESAGEKKAKGTENMDEIGPPIIIRPVPDLAKSFSALPLASPHSSTISFGLLSQQSKKPDPLLTKGKGMRSSMSASSISNVDEKLRKTLLAHQRKKK